MHTCLRELVSPLYTHVYGLIGKLENIQKDTCTPIAVLFTIAKTWKQGKCLSSDEWIKKMLCIYTM